MTVIPYGLDTESFRPLDKALARQIMGIPLASKVLLFVAQWLEDDFKGWPTLLRAVDRLRAIPDLCLLTIGHGSLGNTPVPNISLGPVSDEERLCLAYNAADLLVLPSVQENFPNAALEAIACGLPIVGSRVGGVPEIVRDDYTGRLVEARDADGLAGAIKKLLEAPNHLRDMAVRCRRIAVQEYALDIQARRYADLYASLVQPQANSATGTRLWTL